jgi:uncharacterized protein (TIGR00725 family)
MIASIWQCRQGVLHCHGIEKFDLSIMRLLKIAIIGPNTSMCSDALSDFGVELGRRLCRPNRVFVCGGMGGWMEAVCKGVKQSPGTWDGQTIGILPGDTADAANPFIDITIPSGMGIARNALIVNTADVLIAAGGGAGTLSEIAFAWQKQKPVLCVAGFGGWAAALAGQALDARHDGLLIAMDDIDAIGRYLDEHYMVAPCE